MPARLDDVWPWSPDLIVVYVGWNDHWNSLTGRTDAELASLRVFEPFHARLQHAHTYWVLARLVGAALGRSRREPVRCECPWMTSATTSGRLPIRQSSTTAGLCLSRRRRPWRKAGSPIGPSAFRQYYEMTRAEIHNIPATHRQYTDAVREVAAQEGQFVLDLAIAWPEQSTELFRSDCVHLTEQGHQRAAEGLIELWQVAIARGAR